MSDVTFSTARRSINLRSRLNPGASFQTAEVNARGPQGPRSRQARAIGFVADVDGTADTIYIAARTPEDTGGSEGGVVPAYWTVQNEVTPAAFLALAGTLPYLLIPAGPNVGLWRVRNGQEWSRVALTAGDPVHVVAGTYSGFPGNWTAWNLDIGGQAPDVSAPPDRFVEDATDSESVNFIAATEGNFFDTDPAYIVAPDEVDDYVSDSGTRILTEALNSLVNEQPWGARVGHVIIAEPSFDPLTNTDTFPLTFGSETIVAPQFVLLAFIDGDPRSGIYWARSGQKWLKAHRRFDRIEHVFVDNVESFYDRTTWFRSNHPNRDGFWMQTVGA